MHNPQPSFPPALPDLPEEDCWLIHYVGKTSRALNVRLDEKAGEDQVVGRLAAAISQKQVRLVAATQAALTQACKQLSDFSPVKMRLLGECIIAAMLGSQHWQGRANAGPCGGGGGASARPPGPYRVLLDVAALMLMRQLPRSISQSIPGQGCCNCWMLPL